MKVVEIRDEAGLQQLQSAWETLLRCSKCNTVFLTWEWITAWWRSYGHPGELRLLAAFDENESLRGVAPLRSQTLRRYGQTVPALSFIGDGSNDSDYLDFIIASGYEKQVMESFRAHLLRELNCGTVLQFNEVPENSTTLPFLKNLAETRGIIWTQTEVPCGTVRLPQSWEDYLSMLQPRFRTKIRSVLRNLETRSQVRLRFCETTEELQRMLPILFDLHTRRWAREGKPGVFGWDKKRDFYFDLSLLLLQRGWLRFSYLAWSEKILACQYGFAYDGSYFQLQEGYEPASEHWSVGIGLRAWSIREFLREGLREYDFLGGMNRHKIDWGAEVKRSKRITVANGSYRNVLLCRGPEWELRTRDLVKAMIPQKILLARQMRLERERPAAFQNRNGHTVPWPARKWARQAAALCYYHCRLPAVARRVRERYQLSISANGKWVWNRRKEPSARILYYHRVNDERDPFFPAISTELFDQEMRFAAQYYKVVSLAQMLEHLKGGVSENVLAITLDDGYQDNYWNAFPVLQRYGLPATIFLTTGSIDSREPLWFEQLTSAVKKTAREFVDLEIDFPQRFWLRTQAERLESNGRIFGLLRGLPDSERRQWLAQVLRQLSASDNEEPRNQMLTWDQVRLMKAHGIDFGGHTVTHPFLSKLRREQVMWEVSECKRRIEEEVELQVRYFAYPNGREEDFSDWNKELIRSAGYQAALTTLWGVNCPCTDPMELRRGGPWEERPALFAYKLDWYQLTDS